MINNETKKLLAKSIKLDKWRKQFNNTDFGLGFDPYKPNDLYHYPEAYAFWGMGYLNLFHTTQNPLYLQFAKKCYEWLIGNSLEDSTGISWGLPWDWERWDVAKGTGYLISTVFVGDLLIDLFKILKEESIILYLEKIAQWIERGNGFGTYNGNTYGHYANSPGLLWYILNPSAKAAAFFFKLSEITKNSHFKKLGQELTQTILQNQAKDGGWYYGERSKIKDITHNAFVAESLLDIYLISRDAGLLLPLMEYLKFFKKSFLTKSGKCYWRSMYGVSDLFDVSPKPVIKDLFTPMRAKFFNYDFEAPLWGYSSSIRLLTKLSRLSGFEMTSSILNLIMNYMETNLENSDGSFRYKSTDERIFIRHQAHTFCTLTEHLVSMNIINGK